MLNAFHLLQLYKIYKHILAVWPFFHCALLTLSFLLIALLFVDSGHTKKHTHTKAHNDEIKSLCTVHFIMRLITSDYWPTNKLSFMIIIANGNRTETTKKSWFGRKKCENWATLLVCWLKLICYFRCCLQKEIIATSTIDMKTRQMHHCFHFQCVSLTFLFTVENRIFDLLCKY